MLKQATRYHRQAAKLQVLAEQAGALGLIGFRLTAEVRPHHSGNPSEWTPTNLCDAFYRAWRGAIRSTTRCVSVGYVVFLRRVYAPNPSALDMPRLDVVAWATSAEQRVALFTEQLRHALPLQLKVDPFWVPLRDPLGEATHYLGITYDREELDREWADRWGIPRIKIVHGGRYRTWG